MQAQLEHKFVFFKKETNPNLRKLIIASLTGTLCAVLMLGAVGLTVKKVASDAPKPEVVAANVVQKSFAAENIEIFKYFSTTNTVAQEQLKKDFPQYDITSKEFKPTTGWMRKDNLHIHFDISAQGLYISYNGLKVAQAYELKEAFDSVASGYETTVSLDKDSINIIVSNYKSKSAQLLKPAPSIYPAIPSIEESVKTNQEIKKLMRDIQKKHDELVSVSAIESTMNILQPVTPLIENFEHKQIKKLNEQLESVKLNNLIIQEQIKQAELLKKLSKY